MYIEWPDRGRGGYLIFCALLFMGNHCANVLNIRICVWVPRFTNCENTKQTFHFTLADIRPPIAFAAALLLVLVAQVARKSIWQSTRCTKWRVWLVDEILLWWRIWIIYLFNVNQRELKNNTWGVLDCSYILSMTEKKEKKPIACANIVFAFYVLCLRSHTSNGSFKSVLGIWWPRTACSAQTQAHRTERMFICLCVWLLFF